MPIETIRFAVDGETLVGNLHTPDGPGPFPALIAAGPMTSVKEQVTGVYAAAMAARGLATLAIDHRHFGQSGGTPRQYEYSRHKIEDLRAALDVLATRIDIDRRRIGAMGVCLGAGYAAWATVDNPAVRAFGAVAGYYRDVADMRARDSGGFDSKVAQGRAARARFEETGEVITIPAVALYGDAAMSTPELFDYYATPRAGVPNYANAFAVMSREHFLPFDVQGAAARLRAPALMIHSEHALSPAWARKFYDALPEPKRIEWIDSPGQTAFYDDPELVRRAADLLAAHFSRHLIP